MSVRPELEGLPKIGAERTTRARTITESDLVCFSALTGDWHPQHSDADWAATSRFGERIAHGMLVISYAIGSAGFDPKRVVALRGLDSVRLKRPVRIGETIRAGLRVEELTPADEEHALVALALRVRNQTDQLVARARLEVLWRRSARAGGDDAGAEDEQPNLVLL